MFKARHSQTCPGKLVAVVEEEKQEEEEGRKNTHSPGRGALSIIPVGKLKDAVQTPGGWDGRSAWGLLNQGS